jgi:hypothetical protein
VRNMAVLLGGHAIGLFVVGIVVRKYPQAVGRFLRRRWDGRLSVPLESRDYRHWRDIGAVGVSVGALGDVGWYTVVQVVPSRVHPPWWPYLLFSFLIGVGAYFLLAGRCGWPVPLDKLERQRLKFAREVKEANEKRAAETLAYQAAEAARKEEESRSWLCSIGLGFLDPNDSKNYNIIALNCPARYQSAQFIGRSADCEIKYGEHVYKASVRYVDVNRGFRLRFPEDFAPLPERLPGDYLVTWRSEVLDVPITKGFQLDRFGLLVK